MSSTAQVALLPPRRRLSKAQLWPPRATAGTGTGLIGFALLGLYGTASWARLLSGPTDERRLFGLLVLAVALAGIGRYAIWRRALLVIVALLGLALTCAVSGVPLIWITHLRIAVTWQAVGDGMSALPRLLVPYLGVNPWVRMVIVLGAGLLLLDAAVLFAFASRSAGLVRRGAAALPLVALATVPATVVHPRYPYLDGIVLFTLLALYLWGDRIDRYEVLAAAALCGLTGVAGMVIAPALDRHRPWLDYQTLTGRLASGGTARFDWSQTYGPVAWPRTGQTVLKVWAQRPDYWKAEDLDVFDGNGWTSGPVLASSDQLRAIPSRRIRRWTQTLQLTLGPMTSSQVIGAGVARPPVGLQTGVVAGVSPGTWATRAPLGRGDSYRLTVYDPQPSHAQLAAAGADYPLALLPGYLTVAVPQPKLSALGTTVVEDGLIPPFGSRPGAAYGASASPAAVVSGSPYARAYALARRLVRRSPTPYAYVRAVERYLGAGFSYDQSPVPGRYPLARFLFATRAGDCQQFAGAMALLLRLGGIPARVAVGFTTGSYDTATKQWLVSDTDAHAWVEAYFPGYGWVRFDPTPSADPALGGRPADAGVGSGPASPPAGPAASHREGVAARAGGARAGAHHGRAGASDYWLIALVLAAGCWLVLAIAVSRPLRSVEDRVAELVRAFARTGRPLAPSTTLAALERRFAGAPLAVAYIHALGLQRFAAVPSGPGPGQRRALRAALRHGLGVTGTVRAWWALPPRRGG